MSACNADVPILDVAITKESSTLPAKHFKSLSFGYWMIAKMKNDAVITDAVFDVIMKDYLKVYDVVPTQVSHYETFDDDFKMVSKDLKKLIKDFHKPPKVKKEKKTVKVKDDADKPKKRGRPSKKTVPTEDNDDLISSIVTAAFDNMDTMEQRVYTRVKVPSIQTLDDKPKPKDDDKPKAKELDKPKAKDDDKDNIDYCLGCETGADSDSAHINHNTGLHWLHCQCHDTELIPFTFTKDNFKCLLHKHSLSLYDFHTQNLLTDTHTHSLHFIQHNNLKLLLDQNNLTYPPPF